MKKLLSISWVLAAVLNGHAQDSAVVAPKLMINGYIKDLQTLTFNNGFKELTSGNLIHNRLNIKWRASGKFTVVTELRNRLFWGEEVKRNPGFAAGLRNENEKLDMQKTWINDTGLVLHTNVERLYFDYRDTRLNIRLGRQRINWGMATTWNPNDIFNSYNFLDFDYEERPGADGAKCQYLFSNAVNVEIAYANTGKKNGNIAAAKFALNKWKYDIQLIMGWFYDHPTFGAGWAGSIKDAGFKGEFQYHFAGKNSSDQFNLSLEGDYMFKKNWYLNFSLLYNHHGLDRPVSNWSAINLDLSPQNIMPTKWNMIVTTSKELTPLLSANMSVLFSPGTNLFIFFPSVQYNIAANLDLNLVWQSFYIEMNNNFEAVNNHYFLRMKWSF